MRVPTRVTAQVRPARQPLQYLQVGAANATAFGSLVGQSLQGFGGALHEGAVALKERRDQEVRINSNGLLTQFEIDQNERLEEMNRDAANLSNIDENFSTQFIQGANDLLAQAPDAATRQYMENQLLGLYGNMTIRAQGYEQNRNEVTTRLALTDQLDAARNIVLADPTQLDAQAERLTTAVMGAGGILPRNEVDASVRAYLQGLTESAYLGRIMGGQAEVVMYELLGGTATSPGEAALIYQESGGNPGVVNQFGFAGLYQFGAPQLQTLGLYAPGTNEDMEAWDDTPANEDGKWSGQFRIPGHPEVRTLQDFLNNPAAQQAAYRVHTEWIDQQIESRGLDQYIGETVQGVLITQQGLRNMIHFAGVGGATAALRGQGNARDANGAAVMDYARIGSNVIGAAGGVGNILAPDQTERLISRAQTEINREAQAFQAQQNALLTQFGDLTDGLLGEIGQGYVPNFDTAGAIAAQIVGEAGQAAQARLGFVQQLAPLASSFARSDPIVRSSELREMEEQRQRGELSPAEIEIHDLLAGIDDDIRTAAETDGYGEAVRRGLVSAVPLTNLTDIGAIATREAQAQTIRASLSPTASVVTQAEMETIRQALGGDVGLAYQVMARLSVAPTLVGYIQTQLAEENSPTSRAWAVAFDHAADNNEQTTVGILQGIRLAAGGAPTVPLTTADQAVQNIYDTTGIFEGMEHLMYVYRDAAMAHYIGVNGGPIDRNLVTWDQLRDSFLAVLPGHVVVNNPGFWGQGQQLLTPRRLAPEINPQQWWNEQIDMLVADPKWWDYAATFDTVTNTYVPLTEAPTYANGEPVRADEILRQGELRMAGEGLYWAFTPGGNGVVVDGRQVVIDLRRDVRRPTFGGAAGELVVPGAEGAPGGVVEPPALPPKPGEEPRTVDPFGLPIGGVQPTPGPIQGEGPAPVVGNVQAPPTRDQAIQQAIAGAPALPDLTANTFDQLRVQTGMTEEQLIPLLAERYGNTPEQMGNLVVYLRNQQLLRRDDGNKPLGDNAKFNLALKPSRNVVDLRWMDEFPSVTEHNTEVDRLNTIYKNLGNVTPEIQAAYQQLVDASRNYYWARSNNLGQTHYRNPAQLDVTREQLEYYQTTYRAARADFLALTNMR